MKRSIAIALAASAVCGCSGGSAPPTGGLEGRVTLSGAWALYPMAVRWAEEFRKIHPAVTIDIAAGGAGKGMVDCLAGAVDIGMVSRAISPAEAAKGAWWVAVTKDAVVPMVNEANPAMKDILARGVKRETFEGIWGSGKVKGWGEVAGREIPGAIAVFTRSDACGAAETWAAYLGRKQEDLLGVGVYGDPGLAEAVRNDPLGIGYNNVNFAYDPKTKAPVQGLKPAPIDIDGNGRLDPGENFYGTRDELMKAIADGRYPSPPARNLHFVCKGAPEKKAPRAFIEWVLGDGQAFVPEAGYVNLSPETLRAEREKLKGAGMKSQIPNPPAASRGTRASQN